LRENAEHWTNLYLTRLRKNPKSEFKWPRGSAAPIRKRLAEMTNLRCAFCDGGLRTSSPDTIEHFHPKHAGAFPELAFAWTNLFPCCCQCNETKGKKFQEQLLNPAADDYSFGRYFLCNHATGEIEISPLADSKDQERARITCELYGLNSPARMQARKEELKKWIALRDNGDFILDDFEYRFFLEP
jgi:uncharacterized protein (TIGR02646 family)